MSERTVCSPAPMLFQPRIFLRLIDRTRGWLTGAPIDPAFPMVMAGWLLLCVARPHVVARLG